MSNVASEHNKLVLAFFVPPFVQSAKNRQGILVLPPVIPGQTGNDANAHDLFNDFFKAKPLKILLKSGDFPSLLHF
jgi:hypothetical protein